MEKSCRKIRIDMRDADPDQLMKLSKMLFVVSETLAGVGVRVSVRRVLTAQNVLSEVAILVPPKKMW